MKIAFLPLDTRPCTYDFPVQLSKQTPAEIVLPPKDLLCSYDSAANTLAVSAWLEEASESCQAVVVSIEQLLHGGLVQSRSSRMSAEEQLTRLEVLKRIKDKNPDIRIYVSNVLMRTSVSMLGADSVIWWEKVNLYSKLRYRALALEDHEAQQQCSLLESEIPVPVLQTYLTARLSNHETNRQCIRLAAEGIIDKLLILQEDCGPEGIHRF